jgi:cell division protein FtsQ
VEIEAVEIAAEESGDDEMTSMTIDPRLQARRVEVLRLRGRRRLQGLAVLAVIAMLGVGTWWLVLESPLFDVDAVSIEGITKTDPGVALDAAAIEKGQALLEVDVGTARDNIVALPWVESVTSDRSLSGDVRFTVSERTAVAVVAGESGWLLVDAHGRVLEQADTVPAGVVVVDGSTWAVSPGGWIGERALPALDVAGLLPGGLRPKVASIKTGETDLELMLFGGGRVVLGDGTELQDKFLSALTLLSRIDLACLEVIDVRAPSVPVLTRVDACS